MPVGAMRLQKTFQVRVTRGRPEMNEKMTRNKPERRNFIVKWKRVTATGNKRKVHDDNRNVK